jgi:hypothetical protein
MSRHVATWGLTALLSLAAVGGCANGPAGGKETVHQISADYPVYDSSADILETADLVIRGAVVSSRVEKLYPELSTSTDPVTNPQAGLSDEEVRTWREDSAVVVTVATVRVAEVIKGAAAPGDLVEVSQLGGLLDGVRHTEEHTRILPAGGGDFVLLLAAHGKDRPYDLLNPEQAMYEVRSAGSLAGPDDLLQGQTVKELRAEVAELKD